MEPHGGNGPRLQGQGAALLRRQGLRARPGQMQIVRHFPSSSLFSVSFGSPSRLALHCFSSLRFALPSSPLHPLASLPTFHRKGANSLRRQYVLPSERDATEGWVLEEDPPRGVPEPVLNMGVERLIPELLFRPTDLGLRQAGVSELLLQSLEAIPSDLHVPLTNHVLLVGGNTLIPGYVDRLESELRSLLPADTPLRVKPATRPLTAAAEGLASFVHSPLARAHMVTKEEYEEQGWLLAFRRFAPF